MLHEPTTSITDFILGVEAICFAAILASGDIFFPSLPYWIATLTLLGLAGFLGGFAHGFANRSIFIAVYLSWAALMVAFLLATMIDGLGIELAARLRWPLIVAAIVFVLIARRFPTYIQIYVIIEAMIMLAAFFSYLRLALIDALPGAGYIAVGIALTLIAAGLFVKKARFSFIWTFDRNGVYHLAQMVAVVFLYLGLHLRK